MPIVAVHPLGPAVRSTATSSRLLSVRLDAILWRDRPNLLRRVFSVLAGFGRVHQRYSVAKFKKYDQYRRSMSSWWVAGLLLFAPIPGFVCPVLPAFIPLHHPSLGLLKNPGFMAHYVYVIFMGMLGATIILRAGMQLNNQQYPPSKLVLIVSISLVAAVLAFFAIALCWRFPIPFTLTIALGPGCVILGTMHFVFLANLLKKTSPLRTPILLLWVSVLVQCSQLVIYPAVSAVFEAVLEAGKIALTLVFPVIKYVIKIAVRNSGKVFGDSSEEIAAASVEISSSLYQSIIMQNSPSVIATAIIIGLDVLQGLLAVKLFMDKPSSVSRHRIIDTALAYVRKTKDADRSFRSKVDELRDGDEVLFQALELLQSAENILFIEYFEVAIPLLNAASSSLPPKSTRRITIPSSHHSMQITNGSLRVCPVS